jgi:hypothetical protein
MHSLIGLLILIGAAGFVVFAFRQGMGAKSSGREDDQSAVGMGSGSGYHPPSDGGLGHS